MNTLQARQLFQKAWHLAAFLAVILAAGAVHAQEAQQQADRFLIIFETSPVVKKNLPTIDDMLGEMFAGNLQNEIKAGDDLAVWTVDDKLHTGTFSLESWSPDEAAEYAERLNDFLGKQKYRRSANLGPIQPLLNHVVKNSERLTVLIFCDSQSHLSGTPYDDGVNDIITNAAVRLHGGTTPFIVVLRTYHGQYLGCSVNRSGVLNFPKFPAPPKLQPPPVVIAAPAPPPPPAPVTGPVVTPIPALVIIGTNASTNASALLKPAPAPSSVAPATVTTPAPALVAQTVANPPAPAPTPTTPAPIILSGPPPTPAPNVPSPAPVLVPTPQNGSPAPTTPAPETTVASTPTPVTPPAPEVAPASNTVAAASAGNSTDAGYVWPLVIAGAAIVLAIVIVLWLVFRSRRPQGSLITSSMADDPRLPPRR